jgi:hypothetical protein
MKFRKKPVVIEAMQFNGLEDYLKIVDWAKSFDESIADGFGYTTPIMLIPTLEGTMSASPGDWIIRGVNGEFYPCKPDIFEKTYDKVELPKEISLSPLTITFNIDPNTVEPEFLEDIKFEEIKGDVYDIPLDIMRKWIEIGNAKEEKQTTKNV